MDRDKRWDRIALATKLLVDGDAEFSFGSVLEALDAAYTRDENDEFVAPSRIGDAAPIADGDAILFMNFRADRARQLTQALTDPSFSEFDCRQPTVSFVATTEYYEGLNASVAFAPDVIGDTLGEVIASNGMKQARIAETEKYAHVTFFFSGGREALFDGEERVLIPSPNVATYDLQPEMSANEVTAAVIDSIENQSHELIVLILRTAIWLAIPGILTPQKKLKRSIVVSPNSKKRYWLPVVRR